MHHHRCFVASGGRLERVVGYLDAAAAQHRRISGAAAPAVRVSIAHGLRRAVASCQASREGTGRSLPPGEAQRAAAPAWSDEASAAASLGASIAVGALLGGAGVGLDDALPEGAQHLSSALGWMYFTAWSISFWPQVGRPGRGVRRRPMCGAASPGGHLGGPSAAAPSSPAALGAPSPPLDH
jgi:hypothetical protein